MAEEMQDQNQVVEATGYTVSDDISEPAPAQKSKPRKPRAKTQTVDAIEQESDLLPDLEEATEDQPKKENSQTLAQPRIWEAKTTDGEILSFKTEEDLIDKLIEAINSQSTYDQAKFFADQYTHPEVMEVFNQKFGEEAADY